MKRYNLNLLFLALLAGFMSCSKEEDANNKILNSDDLIPVTVRIAGINSAQSATTRMNKALPKVVTESDKKNNSILRARLTPTEEVQTRADMNIGVRYRVYFFNTDGKCAGYKEIIAGEESEESNQIALRAGLYTVVGISFNSAKGLDETLRGIPSNPLGELIGEFRSIVSPTAGDLLFTKQTYTVSTTDNAVPLTFNHLFNQITLSGSYTFIISVTYAYYMLTGNAPVDTDGTINTSQSGGVTGSATIDVYNNATLSFADGTLTPQGESSAQEITYSTPTLIYLPAGTNSLTFTIKSAKDVSDTSLGLADKTITFSGDISAHTNYTLTFGYTTNLSGTLTALYWAPGNLKYSNGEYSFFDSQFDYDTSLETAKAQSLFKWNALYPYSNASSSANTGAYDEALDPCSKVTDPPGSWRTPTGDESDVSEFARLQTLNFNGHAIAGAANPWGETNPGGYWFGSTLTSADTSDPDPYEFLYLPAAGNAGGNAGSFGFYWSSTGISGGNHAYNLYLGVYRIDAHESYNRATGFAVRCVSDTK